MAKKAAKEVEVATFDTFGVDAMAQAITEELQNNEENSQSIRAITKKAVKAVLQAEHDMIQGAVANGDKVTYVGFGTFEKRHRAARKGRNPQSGAEIDIKATNVPAFKAGKGFKEAVK